MGLEEEGGLRGYPQNAKRKSHGSSYWKHGVETDALEGMKRMRSRECGSDGCLKRLCKRGCIAFRDARQLDALVVVDEATVGFIRRGR